jgi:hypothetical protein
MESNPIGRDAPLLEEATGVIKQALAEACGADLRDANTAQLLRIEKALVTAADAAEKAVSIRQRAKLNRTRQAAHPPMPGGAIDDTHPEAHRSFVDESGVAWDAFAVHPSADTTGKGRLPEPYQQGWLSFDSGFERRRLSPIPDGWPALTEEALCEAWARAEPAAKRPVGTPMTRPVTNQ